MLRSLYDRVIILSASRFAPVWLAAVAFAESSFFPIPPDVLLVPMALARPARAYRFALICTVASVLGGMLGYWIGYALYEGVALPLIEFYHLQAKAGALVQQFQQYGLYVILAKGLTPIPYKLVTIASGMAHFDFGLFVVASVVTRGVRFFAEAAALRYFGDSARHFIENRLGLVTTATLVCIILGFAVLRYV
ncbi:MAG: YqaA family protein [Acetobacteraceae bacterium]|nr:YqaA family protein [Acetobacteraceae bacterium]